MGRQSNKAQNELEQALQTDRLVQSVVAGRSIARAAEDLGMSYNTAQRLYHKALRAIADESHDMRQEALGRELKTLDLLQRALWPAALSGHVRSVEVMLAVMDRRAKYLGLDAAIKVQLDATRVDDALGQIANVIDGEVAAEAAPLLRAVPGA